MFLHSGCAHLLRRACEADSVLTYAYGYVAALRVEYISFVPQAAELPTDVRGFHFGLGGVRAPPGAYAGGWLLCRMRSVCAPRGAPPDSHFRAGRERELLVRDV